MGRIESKKRLKAVIFLASFAGVLLANTDNTLEKMPFFKTKNHIYLGFKLGTGAGTRTTMWQQAYKNNPTCPNDACYGEKLQAHYKGNQDLSYSFQVGDEISIDKYHILGLRVWGDIQYANAQLGKKVGGNTKLANKNYNPSDLRAYDPNTGQQGALILQETKSPQNFLFNNGHFMAFGLNLNVFVNIPIDVILKQSLKLKKMLFLKMGIFAGGGVEYAILWSPKWENQNTQQNDKFFSAGGGFFVNFGGSLYVGRHNRLNVGLKIPYYSLNAQSWKNFGSSNVWQQQTMRQHFKTFRNQEIFVSYAYLF
ncbi:outer membrane beta-barrel protein [Helicobacter cetorum]|uniref:Outer membrane protein n=1 Tax=Helicobacter cetorum (strain ATCC BAA-429 / MIT 00-7128) TaxID=182217 RepID=I0ENL8_HELC0|nr:outer membrane beta-barrel protein [Helicobacter cetorum]AFI04537.1 outer membrane protein [Helicobacter cetorum MIT 00-7128]